MRLLLIDTCGDTGSLALAEGAAVLRERNLAARAASARLVGVIREELAAVGWPLHTLGAVVVINGPGSFTGVRVGLAAAKGLCDVASLRLLALSRLEVLLSAGGGMPGAVAVLDAGRGEFYVRSADDAEEQLLGREDLLRIGAGQRVLIAEEKLFASLEPIQPVLMDLSAASALRLASAQPVDESDSVATADANYVRHARALYAAGQTVPEAPEPR